MTHERLLVFLDTEFIEDGHSIDLISIGMVDQNGREFYAENAGADLSRADPWVRQNVLPRLIQAQKSPRRVYRDRMAEQIRNFIGDATPEFWGYFADYDWVVFCQIFGKMIDLPKGWPMFCMDLRQWMEDLGPETHGERPKQEGHEHHALAAARYNKRLYDWLLEIDEGLD